MRYRLALLLLPMLLGSCQLGMEVRVTGPPSAPVIELDDGSRNGPEINRVSVWQAGARQAFWAIEADDCRAVALLHYGDVPAGFVAAGAAAPLEPGRSYMVVAEGCGYSGGAWFKIAGGRLLSRNGTGDAARREIESAS